MDGAIVVDASALVDVLMHKAEPELTRQVRTAHLMAPDFVDVEFLSVLRRLERSGEVDADDGGAVLRRLEAAPIVRMPCMPLITRVWELRHSVTPYDAAYVALAEQLDVPLVTCDGKLAKAHGHRATIELHERG